ncbi:MAG: 4Fe-4S binding protein [Planctomycetota bacterium]|nr:4Fe-4S binding protein [Planctomycetota bacterium]
MPAQTLPAVDLRLCTVCGDCVVCCPVDCLRIDRSGAVVVTPHKCVSCAVCAAVCPVDAIAMSPQDW